MGYFSKVRFDMNRDTMRQKSRDELEEFIRRSEELVVKTQEEILWAREIVASKVNEISLKNGIYYAKAKGSAEVLLVEVSNFKACSYIDPSVFGYYGVREYRFTRRLNVRIIKDKFMINHDSKQWVLESLIPDNVATLNIYLTQVPVLSEYDRLLIIKQWLKVLNSYPKIKPLLNELINKVNEYYGLRLGKLDGIESDLFLFTDKDKYKAFIEKSSDYKLAHNQLVAVRNIIYFIREFAYSRDYDKIKSQIENKLEWYDKQILERNQEAFKL